MKSGILVTVLCFFIFSSAAYCQFDILEKVKDKIEQKAEEEVDEQIDGVLNGSEDESSDNEKSVESKTEAEEEPENINEPVKASAHELSSYSKYDFIPGTDVIFFTDFSNTEVGDFPAEWNTNGSAEIVTLNNYPGKWFKFDVDAVYELLLPKFNSENVTFEFDLIMNGDFSSGGVYNFEIVEGMPEEAFEPYVPGKGGAGFEFIPTAVKFWNWKNKEYGGIDNVKEANVLKQNMGRVVHMSAWKQKERLRFYINEEKISDVQRMFDKSLNINKIRFVSRLADKSLENIFISNVRIAVGAPDTRNKLLTEGRLVTRGILFDTGSDKIKPESYGTLKDIADVLNDAKDVKVNIVGHTDSDGDETKNMDLSKRRAASVKNSLVNQFGLNASRFETDGKGESQPASSNNTAEGKANNRRVEFIVIK